MSVATRDTEDDMDDDIELDVDYDRLVADDDDALSGIDTVDASVLFNGHE